MKALTYTASGRFELIEKQLPEIIDPKDAVVRVTLASICSSDLHILHGAVPQACVLYTSPSPRDISGWRVPSSA